MPTSLLGIDFSGVPGAVGAWMLAHGPFIVVVLVAAVAARAFGALLFERIIRRGVTKRPSRITREEKQRADTLVGIMRGTLTTLVWTFSLLMILSEVGVDIGPLLAAAGIAGIAIGFGGQYLIRDVVAGLFVIAENQYRVGDVACLDGTCGLVEDISLRMTTLRDQDGTVHHLTHGTITKVSNMSKGFARVNLNVGVSYSADLEKVIEVVNRVGKALAEDPVWKERILSAPQFLRVDDFGDSAVVIKILGDTKPIAQWELTGELRKRLKIAFDAEGIEIPFPQRVIHQADASR